MSLSSLEIQTGTFFSPKSSEAVSLQILTRFLWFWYQLAGSVHITFDNKCQQEGSSILII